MKNYTIEIDVRNESNALIQYYDFIYKMKPSVDALGVTDAVTGGYYYYENQNQSNVNISSLYIDGVKYVKVSMLEDLFSLTSGFYFNFKQQELYIKFESNALKLDSDVNIGQTTGISLTGDAYYNNSLFPHRFVDLPVVSQKADSLKYGVLKFTPMKFNIANPDGEYDTLLNSVLFGQEVRMYEGDTEDEYDDYNLIYRGNIEEYDNDFVTLQIKATDQRKNLSYTLPDLMLYTSDYPNLKENKYLPVAYGDIRGGVTVCTTEETAPAPATHTFYFMDTTYHSATSLSTVYANGVAVTPTFTSLASGYFILNAADCVDGTSLKTITCDFKGANLDNSIDIIQDLLTTYCGVLYNSDFFDTTEWEAARLDTYNVSVYSKSDKKIIDLIKDIAGSNIGSFMQKSDGRYTFRTSNPDRTPAFSLTKYELGEKINITEGGADFFTDVLINYDPRRDSNTYREYLNYSQRESLRLIYKTVETKTIKTLLTSAVDAAELSEFYLDAVSVQQKILSVDLELKSDYQCSLYDIVTCPYNRALDNLGKFEVIEYEDDHNNRVKNLKLRYMSEA